MAHNSTADSMSGAGAVIGAMLVLHVVVWVCFPSLLEGSIRLDVAEQVLRGREWLLAYPKHPPFSTWLVALASALGPARYVAVFLLGQVLAVTGLLLAALLLRRKNSAAVTLAVLIGLASPFLTYVPIQVNHNIAVMPFWGLALLAGFYAFERGYIRDWILFGAAVGLGMWAKYSILHLVLPLAVAFLAVPAWRRQLATPGPWIAVALAAVIVVPHVVDLASSGSGALRYAIRTNILGFTQNLRSLIGFLLGTAALLALMAIVAAAAAGVAPLRHAVAQSLFRAGTDRLTLYLHVALFGPLALIVLSSLLDVRPRVLWLTPIALSAAVWWAGTAITVEDRVPGNAIAVTGVLAIVLATSYTAWRMVTPLVLAAPSYADFDGPALARLAESHWRAHADGPIPYVVSFDHQRGRQAAGSIVFDIADWPHAFENADPMFSPRIDIGDLTRRGALVVSTRPITPGDSVASRPVENIAGFQRPTVRAFARPRTIHFGIVRPTR